MLPPDKRFETLLTARPFAEEYFEMLLTARPLAVEYSEMLITARLYLRTRSLRGSGRDDFSGAQHWLDRVLSLPRVYDYRLLTMLNMLIGVICDVVGSVVEDNKEEVMLQNVHNQITSMVHEINDDNDVLISREEFNQLVAPRLPHPFHRIREPPLRSPDPSAGPPLPKAGAGSSNCARSSRPQV